MVQQGKAVLWDLDGVIADTGDLHILTWRMMLNEMGVPFDEQYFRRIFGMVNSEGIPLLLGRPASPEEIARLSERKEALFRELLPGRLRPVPGAVEWIRRLREDGWRQAVASSAPRLNIEAMLGELGLTDAFEALVCAEELPAGKPDPAVFLKAAETLRVLPAHCIVVEDALVGIEAARRAGMKCIAVTTTHPAEELQGADLIVATPAALPPDAFERLLNGL
ncbi:MAG: HAD family phosphatase [Anaerolineae bacterium]|nr:HAD family phosphatase [Anaerolineae bacterium]MDW8098831.1 HAD family phosphatase [Anaerolineae bacterium]